MLRALTFFLLSACMTPRQAVLPAPLALTPAESVRLVLVGDTGIVEGQPPGDPAACDLSDRGGITYDCRAALIASMRAEQADALIALGDLVYWSGPTCPPEGLTPQATARFDEVLGDYLGVVGPPVLVAMGNHDKHQRNNHPAAERCFLAYAAQHPALELPDMSFLVEIGPVLVVVVDTTRPPVGDLARQVMAAISTHRAQHPEGWVVVAGHHPVRTYRDDTLQPAKMSHWLDTLGLKPDLWVNGHAHYHQMTVMDGVPDVTTGAGGKLRHIRECQGENPACGEFELWSDASHWGYAVATLDDQHIEVQFKDALGEVLYTWQRTHAALATH